MKRKSGLFMFFPEVTRRAETGSIYRATAEDLEELPVVGPDPIKGYSKAGLTSASGRGINRTNREQTRRYGMTSVAPRDTLGQLRRAVAKLDPSSAASFGEEAGRLPLGLPEIDAALQGGLARGTLHELAPGPGQQSGAATGFALALAALAALAADGRSTLWIQTDFAALEEGIPHGPGVDLFGLALQHLLILRVSRPLDLLWAFEEALKSHSLAAVLA